MTSARTTGLLPGTPADTRQFDDVALLQARVYDSVQRAYANSYPLENAAMRLELQDVGYDAPPPSGLKQQKAAIIAGRTLYRPLSGTWRLIDKADGKVLDERRLRIADVPHVTERGTFIHHGSEYTLSSQMRLKPGVYSRRRENGELESHFNVLPGSGPPFRLYMDPSSGVFHVRVGQARIPLYSVLRGLGVGERQIQDAWGRELLAVNQAADRPQHFAKALEKFVGRPVEDEPKRDDTNQQRVLLEALARMRLDPYVTRETLGQEYDRVDPAVLLTASAKLIGISRDEAETDDRDNLGYQVVLGPEDLLAERVRKDAGQVARRSLWRATGRRSLEPLQNHEARTAQLRAALLHSGLGLPLEESNPLDIHDQLHRVTRMGVGGIPSAESIPDEAREVQPSYLGYIDPIRTSESEKAGVDNRVAYNTLKGADGELYTQLLDRNGRPRLVSSSAAARAVVAFPGELQRARAEGDKVQAMVRGRLRMVDAKQVDYEVPTADDMFSALAHLVPFVSAIDGHRMLMATKMFSQALPVRDPEAPLVQSRRGGETDPPDSFEQYFGTRLGAVRSDVDGVFERVARDGIVVRTPKGTKRFELYDHFPFNRRTFVTNTPLVQPGQAVRAGDLLARSNFTDDRGTLALGRNLRVGFFPYRGLTYEDAIVISAGAAKKLASDVMYQHDVDLTPGEKLSKATYVAKFPTKYLRRVMDNIDDNGVVQPGTVVRRGDPLVLSLTRRPTRGQGVLHKSAREAWMDTTRAWEYDTEGTVTDVHVGPRTVNVVVKAQHPVEIGDKLSNRLASKGVVSAVIPDDRMPRGADGQPLEVILQPFGLLSRINPAIALEAALGKIAARRGHPYTVPGFSPDNFVDFVARELKRAGLSSNEDVYDPERNAKIPDVFVGNQYFLRLHHRAEDKLGQRGDDAGYTADMTPARTPGAASKRLGSLETLSLLSAGATNVLRDAKLIRGQRNDDFWRAFRLGYPPPTPEVPFVYRKFLDELVAAGINVKKDGNYVHIMPLTDRETRARSRGRIERSELLDFETLKPVAGGLFDLGLTGGLGGTGWTHIELSEPLPNPVVEEPIRRLLGLTEKRFRAVLEGQEELNGSTGSRAVGQALQRIDVAKEIERQKQLIRDGSRTRRDDAIKRLRTLHMFATTGIKPEELMLGKVPVLPPQFRPVVRHTDRTLVSDPNYLYKELMLADENFRDLVKEVGPDGAGAERLALYDSFKALVGLGDRVRRPS